MSRPEIKETVKNGNSVRVKLSFPANGEYFQGHFPDFPILPGVAQVHWAIRIAEEQFNITADITRLSSVKFSSIIKPEIELCLSLDYLPEKKSISYSYTDDAKKYSSGTVALAN